MNNEKCEQNPNSGNTNENNIYSDTFTCLPIWCCLSKSSDRFKENTVRGTWPTPFEDAGPRWLPITTSMLWLKSCTLWIYACKLCSGLFHVKATCCRRVRRVWPPQNKKYVAPATSLQIERTQNKQFGGIWEFHCLTTTIADTEIFLLVTFHSFYVNSQSQTFS